VACQQFVDVVLADGILWDLRTFIVGHGPDSEKATRMAEVFCLSVLMG